MTGFIAMTRDWQDHAVFNGDPYSRRDAWAWLIANAAWKPTKARLKGSTVELVRGELCFSVRFLARKWRWSKSRVDRFLHILRAEGMIATRSKTETTAGHRAGQGPAVIFVRNYDKFQDSLRGGRDSRQAETGPTAGQQRDKEEEGKKGRKKDNNPPGGSYAFAGKWVRLNQVDYDKWRESYPDLDLRAELQSRDDWLASDEGASGRVKWFVSTSNYLKNLQKKARADKLEADSGWNGQP